MDRFSLYDGDLIGLPTNEKHLNYRWKEPDCKILFSMCRKGNSASCHLASDKRGLRKLRTAMREFTDFVFKNFEWCEMLVAKIVPNSIKKICEKVGFSYLASTNDYDVYCLPKEVYHEFSS
jgi:hypothetical protein